MTMTRWVMARCASTHPTHFNRGVSKRSLGGAIAKLNYAAAGKCEQLKADLIQRITEAALYSDETVPRDRASFDAARKRGALSDDLQHYRWLIEEFRVSLFAQELGTAEKVSAKRLEEMGRGI